ncbi:NACHT domain-containing protein [Streptomyces sp. NPDC050564]|uniref:NACHT domain-containing protein n=1 Tax=Streptomyces sp. NPDC050564 TaxID=3365631 RepID=UPI0037BDD834
MRGHSGSRGGAADARSIALRRCRTTTRRERSSPRCAGPRCGRCLTTVAGPAPELVLSLFGVDAQLAQLSRSLVSGTAERIQGLGRFERTERLAAAHAVIVVAAYGDAMAQARLPFDVRELATTWTDSVRLATGDAPESRRLAAIADHLLRSHLPLPSPHEPYESTQTALRGFYASMSGHMEAYVSGLAVWDRLTPAARQEVRATLHDRVPDAALTFYEEMFRQLVVDFPDVGIWADRVDHRATRVAVRRLEETVTRLVHGDLPTGRLTALRRAGALPLQAPVLGAQDTAEGMVIPSLREAYVSADFRVAAFGTADRLTSEAWWRQHEVHGSLDTFLEGLLTAPKAVEVPILLLGLPGSGKSLLTKVLGARLPAEDFLVVRVPLRDVPADTGIQHQIEAAIQQATGERTMDWADVVRAACPTLPVVLLDGFDELLQATGLHQSDYLERVANFQQREAALGRPLAIVVTSRTAVADRARLTPEGIAIRLEPFSATQTGQWLELWNCKNAAYFSHHGLRPLTPEQALTQPDLASQPLLLLMLALYDAQDNAYQREVGTLAGFELYERLLARFARREVLKHEARLTDEDLAQAIERELLRLSVAAFAMFNRGRQWVTEDELETDLCALLPQQASPPTGLQAELNGAQTTIGRFFFIHRAEAFRDDVRLRSYEFLHSTFGEFLVARLVAHELQDLMAAERAEARRARRSHTDDSFLHALLSFAACAGRGPVVAFLVEALRPLPSQDREELRRLLLRLFHESLDERPASSYGSYQPSVRPAPAAPSFYRANLLLLLLVVAEEISGRELFPTEQDPVGAWRDTMLLLESQLYVGEWRALAGRLSLERAWHGEGRDITVRLEDDLEPDPLCDVGVHRTADPRVVNPYWSYGYGPGSEGRRYHGWLHTNPDTVAWDAHLRCDIGTNALLHMAQVLEDLGLGLALTSYVILPDGEAVSAARLLFQLWSTAGDFSAVHRDAVQAALYSFAPDATDFIKRYLAAVLRQWELAGHLVPQDWVDRVHSLIDTYAAAEAYAPLLDELPHPPT